VQTCFQLLLGLNDSSLGRRHGFWAGSNRLAI
jgi:hypothetical protein